MIIKSLNMFVMSKLRTLILGEPLLTPEHPSAWKLLIYYCRTNIKFTIFIAFVIIITFLLLYRMIKRRNTENNDILLYSVGFLLIFCSYGLQKSTELDILLNNSVKTGYLDMKLKANFGESNLFKIAREGISYLTGKKHFNLSQLTDGIINTKIQNTNLNINTNSADETSNISVEDDENDKTETKTENPVLTTNFENVNDKKQNNNKELKPHEIITQNVVDKKHVDPKKKLDIAHSIKDSTNLNEKTPNLNLGSKLQKENINIFENNRKKSDVNNKPKDTAINSNNNRKGEENYYKYADESYLKSIITAYEFKNSTDKKLQIYKDNLTDKEKKISTDISDFSKLLVAFLEQSAKIEKELLNFDVSTAYLNVHLGDLNKEISKYFNFVPNINTEYEILIYLKTILKNYDHVENNTSSTGNLTNISRTEQYVKFLLLLEVFLCLILFISMLVRIETVYLFLRPVVGVFLIASVGFGVILMMNSHMLDRTCKSGSIVGCKFSEDFEGINKKLDLPGAVTGLDDISKYIEASIKNTENVVKDGNKYIKDLITAKVSHKILVFTNIFKKIIFVETDFDDLTGKKIDKAQYYDIIYKMMRILEQIDNYITQIDSSAVVDIYENLSSFFFWEKIQRKNIINTIKAITNLNSGSKKSMPSGWCVSALQNICHSKDISDVLSFMLLFCSPLFMMLLYF